MNAEMIEDIILIKTISLLVKLFASGEFRY